MWSDEGRGSSPGLIIACICSCLWGVVFVSWWTPLFMDACFHWWVVAFIHGQSPLFVGGHLHLWAFVFMGSHLCLWVVYLLVQCGGGLLVGGGGPHGCLWWCHGCHIKLLCPVNNE